MNIRRLKKKKFTAHNKDEEQQAKDHLFEISYYCDEKFIDQSHFLQQDSRTQQPNIQKQKRTEELERLIRGSRASVKSRTKHYQSKLDNKTLEARGVKFDKCIFNLLQSNSVFVGAKDKEPLSNKETIVIESRKRMQTMPQLKQHQYTAFTHKLKTQQTERTISKPFFSATYSKFHRSPQSLNKRNYSKLKQQLRYDLFVKSLNCTFQPL